MNTRLARLLAPAVFLVVVLSPPWAAALITGGEGNDPVEGRGWPAGSVGVANLETRIAYWEGPPFGGGQYTFEYRGETTADLNKALEAFAKIEAPKKELVLSNDAGKSFWLGIGERGKEEGKDLSIDWQFIVWNAENWNHLFNNPESNFMSDHPNFRKPVDPPRLHVFIGSDRLEWDEVVVPEGLKVVDQRAKPGEKPSITGVVKEIDTGQALAGAKVTLTPHFEMDGPLPAGVADVDGKFVLEGMPEGTYTVLATHKGYAPKKSRSFDPVKAGVKREEEFKLSPATVLEGIVLDKNGNALEGARIIARDVVGKDGLGYNGEKYIEVKTDAAGKFVLEGLPHGQTRLSVWADGWYYPGSVTTHFALPAEKPVTINMIGTGTVNGTIKRKEGRQMAVSIQEAAGEKIGSWGGSMNCKEGGTFEFENVPEGEYLIGPPQGADMKPGDPNTKQITVVAGETVEVSIVEE